MLFFKLKYFQVRWGNLKGTGSPDGYGFCWHIWLDLGLSKDRVGIPKGMPTILHMLDWKTQNPISPRLASIRVKSEYWINHRDIKIPISWDCPFSQNPEKRAGKTSGGFRFLSKFFGGFLTSVKILVTNVNLLSPKFKTIFSDIWSLVEEVRTGFPFPEFQ